MVNIRKMERTDIEEVKSLAGLVWNRTYSSILPDHIQAQTLAQAYSAETMDKRFDKSLLFVAEEQDQIIGYAFFSPEGEHIHLESLYVHPAAQKKGIGRMLMNIGFAQVPEAAEARLLVLKGNSSRSFYEKHGFTAQNEWNGDYDGYPVTFIKMRKRLMPNAKNASSDNDRKVKSHDATRTS